MDTFAHGLRYASRQLHKAPGFTLTVVLTLGLGIGATTAIFSLVEGILLRPLPFRAPERLVLLGDRIGGGPNIPVTAREIGIYSAYELSGDDCEGFAVQNNGTADNVRIAMITVQP